MDKLTFFSTPKIIENNNIIEIKEQLAEKPMFYGSTRDEDEIKFIEKRIKPMELLILQI